MGFKQKVLFPLTDHNDTSEIEHKNVFELEGDRIAIVQIPELEDFETGLGNYAVLNSAARNANQAHGGSYGIECPFQGGSTIEKLHRQFTVPSSGIFYIEKWMRMDNVTDGGAAHVMTFQQGTLGADVWRGPHMAYVGGIGFQWNDGGWNTISGSTILADAWYRIRATFDLSVSDFDFDIWDLGGTPVASQASMDFVSASAFAGKTGWDWMGMHIKAGTGNIYWDDITNSGVSAYPTSSPSPVSVWTALPVGAVIDVSTAKYWRFKDNLIITSLTDTDIMTKKASNGGALGSSETLSAFRAGANITITDIINSFKAVGVYASDGTYESKSSAWLECDVIFPEGGGLLTHPGMQGGMRG